MAQAKNRSSPQARYGSTYRARIRRGSREFYSKLFGWNIEVNIPTRSTAAMGWQRSPARMWAGIGGKIVAGGPRPRG